MHSSKTAVRLLEIRYGPNDRYRALPRQCGTTPLPKANQSLHLRDNIDFEITADDTVALNEQYSSLAMLPDA